MSNIPVMIGVVAFVLFFLYDWCTVKKSGHFFTKWGFYLADLLVLTAVILNIYPLVPVVLPPVRMTVAVILCVLGLGGLIKVLFFSLPKGTYTDPSKKRRVYDGGCYGLCRHPGFWPYLLIFLSLVMIFGKDMLVLSLLLCLLNFLYICFQDLWTFRQIFEDYDDYRKKVPFILPALSSLISWRKRSGKE